MPSTSESSPIEPCAIVLDRERALSIVPTKRMAPAQRPEHRTLRPCQMAPLDGLHAHANLCAKLRALAADHWALHVDESIGLAWEALGGRRRVPMRNRAAAPAAFRSNAASGRDL